MNERRYSGRFAPTPSGPLHFGSLVAAVGGYLEARSRGGLWRLRIDDLDASRVAPGAIGAILNCLEALGLEWDGPVILQSRRRDAYHAALHRLSHLRVAYPCACSRKDIAEAGLAASAGPLYPGTCRAGMLAGRPARTWRLRVAAHIELDDGLLGPLRYDLEREAGDFVLYRADGVYAFHLASAVDDGEPAISDVVRGSDLLESSARQTYLMRLLGLPVPRYTHLPIAVDASGRKLSKQTDAAPVDSSRACELLCAVLRFLNQPLPPHIEDAPISALWGHAIRHWDLQRVGRRLHAPVPS